MKTLVEYLVKGHTNKSYSKCSLKEIFDMIDPSYITKDSMGITYIKGNAVSYEDEYVRPWIYIWKYIYDNPMSSEKDIQNFVDCDSELKDNTEKATLKRIMSSMLDLNYIRMDGNNKYFAINPEHWN